jgi:hypothetical protein
MLWQIDTTPYEWLGEKFGKFTLYAAIDNATGIVVGAFFTPNECMEGYSEVMRQGIKRYEHWPYTATNTQFFVHRMKN